MSSPTDRRYSETHEWFRSEADGTVTVGITKHAAEALTDITFVDMKPAGTKVSQGGTLGEVESVKTNSEIYSPVTGEILQVNGAAAKDPSLLNSDPFGAGWLCTLKGVDAAGLASLMDAATYDGKNDH
jgi:glycine cleavage system H protein